MFKQAKVQSRILLLLRLISEKSKECRISLWQVKKNLVIPWSWEFFTPEKLGIVFCRIVNELLLKLKWASTVFNFEMKSCNTYVIQDLDLKSARGCLYSDK